MTPESALDMQNVIAQYVLMHLKNNLNASHFPSAKAEILPNLPSSAVTRFFAHTLPALIARIPREYQDKNVMEKIFNTLGRAQMCDKIRTVNYLYNDNSLIRFLPLDVFSDECIIHFSVHCRGALELTRSYMLADFPIAARTKNFCMWMLDRSLGFLWDVPTAHRDSALCLSAIKAGLGTIHDVPQDVCTVAFYAQCAVEGIDTYKKRF